MKEDYTENAFANFQKVYLFKKKLKKKMYQCRNRIWVITKDSIDIKWNLREVENKFMLICLLMSMKCVNSLKYMCGQK